MLFSKHAKLLAIIIGKKEFGFSSLKEVEQARMIQLMIPIQTASGSFPSSGIWRIEKNKIFLIV